MLADSSAQGATLPGRGAPSEQVRITQRGALRAERVDADHEEDEDRGRWRYARCYSSDGLGWDKTSIEGTIPEEPRPDNSGYKCYQSMCTDVVIGKTSAYCRPTAD